MLNTVTSAANISYDNTTSGLSATNLQDAADEVEENRSYLSAGTIESPTVTNNGDLTITVSSVDAYLFDNSDFEGKLQKYTIPERELTPSAGVPYVVVVNYNSGSPRYELESNFFAINGSDIVSVVGIFKNTVIRIYYRQNFGIGLTGKVNNNLIFTDGVKRESGLVGSSSGLNIDITAGTWRFGGLKASPPAFDSTVDDMYLWYHSSGVWTEAASATSTINNTQYDDGTDLQTLTVNRWTINYIYRASSDIPELTFIVLGRGDYVSEDAAKEETPYRYDELPVLLQFGAILVARVIIQKDAASGTDQIPTSVQGFRDA